MGRSLASRYFARIGLYLALVALAWVAHHGRALLLRDRETSAASAANVLGLLLSGFYILIAKGVVLVYECRANPNGIDTMQARARARARIHTQAHTQARAHAEARPWRAREVGANNRHRAGASEGALKRARAHRRAVVRAYMYRHARKLKRLQRARANHANGVSARAR